ncbi:hypothetical protein OG875_04440 [Streptomyces sp. NBC_01498]|uniref:hypothetical protein n=1 Tax=Streptomyces sp. NBC_01498 TaxID=2975870 RepID=UPI002E7BFC0C|nr:hypothetical protein [Streptomyces sp. NBC_01498]WTL23909.1 hypothetical protein OG875_04440 [Streptomyces sp. NBC_01498]
MAAGSPTTPGVFAARGLRAARRGPGETYDPQPTVFNAYATFAKEGGRVGSGALGAGTGGVARCAG